MPNEFKESLEAWKYAKQRYDSFLEGLAQDVYPPLEDLMEFLGFLKENYSRMYTPEQRRDFRNINLQMCNWMDAVYRQPGEPSYVGGFSYLGSREENPTDGKSIPLMTLEELLRRADAVN